MVNLVPIPPHQVWFKAEPVRGPDGHIIGMNVWIGEKMAYLDLPPDLEAKVEALVEVPAPVAFKKEVVEKVKRAIKKVTRRA